MMTKKWPLFFLSLLIAGILAFASFAQIPSQFRVLMQREPPTEPERITLSEAWEIAYARALAWHQDATLILLQSTDVDDPDPQNAGSDGRRRTWDAIFASPSASGQRLLLQITNNTVTRAVQDAGIPGAMAVTKKPSIDSPQAIASVLDAEGGFAPGNDKAKGYHYILEAEPPGKTTLKVRGSFKQSPAICLVDPETGQLLSCRYLTYDAVGGILYSPDAGITWQASDLTGQMVPAIGSDPLVEGTGYAAVAQEDFIQVYRSQDGGKTWSLVGNLPTKAGNWTYEILATPGSDRVNNLVVGTVTGLWISNDGGRQWNRAVNLPDGPPQWVAIWERKETLQTVVSITAGPNRGLYSSADLATWTKEADGVFRLSASFDGRVIAAVNEENPPPYQALLLTDSGQFTLLIPPGTLRLAGDFIGTAGLVAMSPEGVKRGVVTRDPTFKVTSWKSTLTRSSGNLAAAPDFPISGLILAGGFRTGVYRSTDSGITWEETLSDPSSVVAGSGEVYDIRFLSSSQAILINGGQSVWKDF
jgi:photosystem II stability/assembly factor-like uncharacterized protein